MTAGVALEKRNSVLTSSSESMFPRSLVRPPYSSGFGFGIVVVDGPNEINALTTSSIPGTRLSPSHLVEPEFSVIPSAVQSLIQHIIVPRCSPSESTAYRLVVLSDRIVTVSSQNTCYNIADFEWYLLVVINLAYAWNIDIANKFVTD
ncbi:hypothetical protein P692DRAFT_20951486 [Suillus brevipes Sb2]|jgi:hypothetical protein|nr:hypothetical protein P692DRAFT_20951486 [Suillus brevipes Sb2]